MRKLTGVRRVQKKGSRRNSGILAGLLIMVVGAAGVLYAGLGMVPASTKQPIYPKDTSPVFAPLGVAMTNDAIASIMCEGMSSLSEIRISSTNETPKAIRGGVLTFHADMFGLDASGRPLSKNLDSMLEISAPQGVKDLGHLSYAINSSAPDTIRFTLKAGPFTREIEYSVINQNVSADNLALLVNKYTTPLARNFRPDTVISSHGHEIGKTAGDVLNRMVSDAASAGVSFYLQSGFRSYASQEVIYNRNVANYGIDQDFSAAPGLSEHQTGFVADVSCPSEGGTLEESFAKTPAFKWLDEHAWTYGFVLRYPKGFEYLTGYTYEPWHYRYIGTELAKLYHDEGWNTLDEFLCIPR